MKVKSTNIFALYFVSVLACILGACDEFFNVDVDKSQVVTETIFNDNANATAALIGIYRSMSSGPFVGGGSAGISMLTGLSSDELHNILQTEDYASFENNEIQPNSNLIFGLWKDAYHIIYQANDLIEELAKSDKVDKAVKQQLTGEALFIRGFCYFYLLNIYGDIPLIVQTKYQSNATASRISTDVVWAQILGDLLTARDLLQDDYVATERIRPNRLAASAMLARVYLFKGEWELAKINASEVLEKVKMYRLSEDVSGVFTRANLETIWELASDNLSNTQEGEAFIIESSFGGFSAEVTQSLFASFQDDDKRKATWIGTYIEGSTGVEYHFPYKYRQRYFGDPTENFVILRLAEQYLIRSEAKTMLGDLNSAADDLDTVRFRAGLPSIKVVLPGISKEELLGAVLDERRNELFAEWGHRWLDIKRLGLADVVLGNKEQWRSTDALYPIPSDEFKRNPKLGKQNDGY